MLKIVHRNDNKLAPPPVEWTTWLVPGEEFTDTLVKAETLNWTVHTVEHRYDNEQGEMFWVLLRRENASPLNPLKGPKGVSA